MVAAIQMAGWTELSVWAVHLIGIAGFSVLIIGMVTRTALGHLGRPLQTDRYMVLCYWLVLVSAILRLLALALPAPFNTPTLHMAGCCLDRGLRRLPVALRADADPAARRQGVPARVRVIRPKMESSWGQARP